MFTCFFDASHAFDRVNHWTLFKKLIVRQVPILYVRVLLHWYIKCNVQFHVKWGSTLSQGFITVNDVRQGGILSLYLFAVYVNDLSVLLNKTDAGCYVNNMVRGESPLLY